MSIHGRFLVPFCPRRCSRLCSSSPSTSFLASPSPSLDGFLFKIEFHFCAVNFWWMDGQEEPATLLCPARLRALLVPQRSGPPLPYPLFLEFSQHGETLCPVQPEISWAHTSSFHSLTCLAIEPPFGFLANCSWKLEPRELHPLHGHHTIQYTPALGILGGCVLVLFLFSFFSFTSRSPSRSPRLSVALSPPLPFLPLESFYLAFILDHVMQVFAPVRCRGGCEQMVRSASERHQRSFQQEPEWPIDEKRLAYEERSKTLLCPPARNPLMVYQSRRTRLLDNIPK